MPDAVEVYPEPVEGDAVFARSKKPEAVGTIEDSVRKHLPPAG